MWLLQKWICWVEGEESPAKKGWMSLKYLPKPVLFLRSKQNKTQVLSKIIPDVRCKIFWKFQATLTIKQSGFCSKMHRLVFFFLVSHLSCKIFSTKLNCDSQKACILCFLLRWYQIAECSNFLVRRRNKHSSEKSRNSSVVPSPWLIDRNEVGQ